MEQHLVSDADGYVQCPHRGQISAEWCEGCPDMVSIDEDGAGIVVVCVGGPPHGRAEMGTASPLREVPDLWR